MPFLLLPKNRNIPARAGYLRSSSRVRTSRRAAPGSVGIFHRARPMAEMVAHRWDHRALRQSAQGGVGTKNHCMHGKDAIIEELLDWRPFDYFTVSTHGSSFAFPTRVHSRLSKSSIVDVGQISVSRSLHDRTTFLRRFELIHIIHGRYPTRREMQLSPSHPRAQLSVPHRRIRRPS
jgi:hypothetical protein